MRSPTAQCILLVGLMLLTTSVNASTIVLDVAPFRNSRGSWANTGSHPVGDYRVLPDWVAGDAVDKEYRNYFIFDLSSVPLGERIIGASLRITSPLTTVFNSDEIYQMFSVATPIGQVAQTTNDPDPTLGYIFEDLGSGPVYSEGITVLGGYGQNVYVPLNSLFVTYAEANRSGLNLIILGGAVTSLDNVPNAEILFTEPIPMPGWRDHPAYLTLLTEPKPVPEPGISMLATFGLASLAARRQRRSGR